MPILHINEISGGGDRSFATTSISGDEALIEANADNARQNYDIYLGGDGSGNHACATLLQSSIDCSLNSTIEECSGMPGNCIWNGSCITNDIYPDDMLPVKWFEIYNKSSFPVNLQNYRIDSNNNTFTIDNTLVVNANSYVVVFITGENSVIGNKCITLQNEILADDNIIITDADGNFVSEINIELDGQYIEPHWTIARKKDGHGAAVVNEESNSWFIAGIGHEESPHESNFISTPGQSNLYTAQQFSCAGQCSDIIPNTEGESGYNYYCFCNATCETFQNCCLGYFQNCDDTMEPGYIGVEFTLQRQADTLDE